MTSSLIDLLALNEFGGHSLRRVAPENTLEAVRQGTLHKIGQGGVVQHHGVQFVARLKAAYLAEESAAAEDPIDYEKVAKLRAESAQLAQRTEQLMVRSRLRV